MEIQKILEQVYDQSPTFRLWYARQSATCQRVILRIMEICYTMGQIQANEDRARHLTGK